MRRPTLTIYVVAGCSATTSRHDTTMGPFSAAPDVWCGGPADRWIGIRLARHGRRGHVTVCRTGHPRGQTQAGLTGTGRGRPTGVSVLDSAFS